MSDNRSVGAFAFFRIALCLLLIFVTYSILSGGSADGWSFSRLLQIFGDSPDVASSVIDLFHRGASSLHSDRTSKIAILQFLIDSWNNMADSLTLVGFFAAGAIQIFAFLIHFLRILFGAF